MCNVETLSHSRDNRLGIIGDFMVILLKIIFINKHFFVPFLEST